MASSAEQTVLEDELTCPVCLDLFKDPHLLPCGHNFCLTCVRQLKRQGERGRFRCPECRENHRCGAPSQKNFKLANIADDFRRRSRAERSAADEPARSPAVVRCDYCPPDAPDDGKGSRTAPALAVKTCLKCEVSMCQEHVRPHLELPAFREHPLTEPLDDMGKRKCEEHDEIYRYYCMDDHVCVCNACTIEGSHEGHTIKTLKNTMKDLKGSLQTQLHRVNRKISKTERVLQQQKEEEQHGKEFLEEADLRFAVLGADVRTALDAFLACLQDAVRAHVEGRVPSVQGNLAKVAEDRAQLQEVHAGVDRLLSESDPFKFIREYNTTWKRYRRLLKKPFFVPECVGIDLDDLGTVMEGKLENFLEDINTRVTEVIESVAASDNDDGEEEEQEDDEEEDVEEEDESEEEVGSEDEETNESGDDLYSPEGEEEEEEGVSSD